MPPYVLIQSNLITKAKSQDPPCLNTSPSLFAHFIINSTSNVVDTLRFPFSLFFYSLSLLPHTPILSPALFSRLNGSYYFFRLPLFPSNRLVSSPVFQFFGDPFQALLHDPIQPCAL